MINLSAFIHSLKITWIRRLLVSQGKWSLIIGNKLNLHNFTCFGNEYTKQCEDQLPNRFWKDVLRAYQILQKANYSDNINEFLCTPIFNNSLFKIGGMTIYYKDWFEKGICFINDLVQDNGTFYTEEDLKDIYNIKPNFLRYHSIISAVKKQIKTMKIKITKKLKQPIIPNTISTILKSTKGTKDIYTILNKNDARPTSEAKWEQFYNFDKATWSSIHMSPFHIAKSTTLQWFQVRINHNILPTKNYLHKIKAIESPHCYYCESVETIIHMLWSCQKTQEFLQQVNLHLQEKNINYNFEEANFIFNIGNSFCDLSFNLQLKHYIFTSKYHNKPLSLSYAINRIKKHYEALKCLAMQRNNMDIFLAQWIKYKPLLEPE